MQKQKKLSKKKKYYTYYLRKQHEIPRKLQEKSNSSK